ncbi:MAG: mucoidy inhibitor MuiA family protein [Rhodothermaceae bacterium]|nr:mucoidy inhibitor MuiA family protein [Rhodothermaceae bacterium]
MILLFLALLLTSNPYTKAAPVTLSSTGADVTTGSAVNRVTVYPSGVRVERSASVRLVRGINNVLITPLQGNIDPESITVSVDGNVTVMSVIPAVNFLESPAATAETNRLNRQKRDLELRIAFQENLVYVLNEEEQALKENRRIEGNPQLSGILYLRDVMDFYRQRLTEISTKRLEIRREISDLNEELRRVNNQLAGQRGTQREPVTEVKVLLDSPMEMTGRIRVSYFSGDAQWQPVYDIRVEDVNSPLRLQYKAGISQRTGENWDNVEIFLSSSGPLRGQQSPVLNPWRIDFPRALRVSNSESTFQESRRLVRDGTEMQLSGIVVDATTNEPLSGANVIIPGTSGGTVTNNQGFFSLQVPSAITDLEVRYIGYETMRVPVTGNILAVAMNAADFAMDEVVVSGYSPAKAAAPAPVVMDTPLSFNFEVPARYTVPGDGEEQQVVITEYDLDAQYTYLAIPKIEEKVWLQARISDWERLNLLNGRANLFLGSTYLGNSRINPSVLTDTLALNLGVDEGIIIDRTKVDQYSSRSFLGGKVTQTLTWDIEVRNTKRHSVTIRLTDQIPVSNRREISVDLSDAGGARHNNETGELVWHLEVGPNLSRTVRFSYQVRHPNDERVVLE